MGRMAMANSGSFRKGEKRPNQGKHGSPKAIVDLREMVLGALSDAGGREYLYQQATAQNPSAFMALVGKCLPKEMKIDATVTLTDLLREVEERRAKREA